MKGQLDKKAQAFNLINAGMISFIGFVLISVLVILFIGQSKQLDLVCGNSTLTGYQINGGCYSCPISDAKWIKNTTRNACCNATGGVAHCLGANTTGFIDFPGEAYGATQDLGTAALIAPQFGQIIVIVVVIVGILAMLAFVGYSAYQRMRR